MAELADAIKIRAHHLLCLLGFRGLGYNQEFINTMKKVAEAVFNKRARLRIVDSCDIICSACPYRKGNECAKKKDSSQEVKKQNMELAGKLGIKIGMDLDWRHAKTLIMQNITPEDLGKLCKRCEWLKFGYCVDGLKQLRETQINLVDM